MRTHGLEDSSRRDRCSCHPPAHGIFHPDGHGNCPDVIALADQVYDSPMALSDLNILLAQGRQFGSAQPTAE